MSSDATSHEPLVDEDQKLLVHHAIDVERTKREEG